MVLFFFFFETQHSQASTSLQVGRYTLTVLAWQMCFGKELLWGNKISCVLIKRALTREANVILCFFKFPYTCFCEFKFLVVVESVLLGFISE